jgi:hypothetical protein
MFLPLVILAAPWTRSERSGAAAPDLCKNNICRQIDKPIMIVRSGVPRRDRVSICLMAWIVFERGSKFNAMFTPRSRKASQVLLSVYCGSGNTKAIVAFLPLRF